MPKPKLNKNYIVPALIAVLVVVGVAAALVIGDTSPDKQSGLHQAAACGPYRHDGEVTISRQRIFIEATKTQAEFTKGLGGRPCIPDDQGMFFAFSKPGQYRFWMKGMRFPIDILWINSDHRVAGVEINVSPSTYYSKFPFFENDKDHPAQYVLELKANKARDLKVNLGTPVIF